MCIGYPSDLVTRSLPHHVITQYIVRHVCESFKSHILQENPLSGQHDPWGNTARLDTLYQDKLTTDKTPTIVYSIGMKYPPLEFSSVNWCKIDVFSLNIMDLHHKMPQTVKIKVNRYTNTYLLMNLFPINQFIFIFSCISAFLSFILSFIV